jgi:hypothetical protein
MTAWWAMAHPAPSPRVRRPQRRHSVGPLEVLAPTPHALGCPPSLGRACVANYPPGY